MSIRHSNISEPPEKHVCKHEGYEYYCRDFVPRGEASQCMVSIYEVPPLKSAWPYHYHVKNEETFYIIRGEGLLKTPEGTRPVKTGDLLFFPADSSGAHRLTNTSPTEPLVYINFDTTNDLDAAVYPDSGKIGIWGKNINRVYRTDDNVDYYDGE